MSSRTRLAVVLFLLVFALGVLSGSTPAGAQPISIDGDLSEWVDPDGMMDDPCNDVIALCKSGFDFTKLLVYYDLQADTLFFGIDIMDAEKPCLQSPDPDPARDVHGVPGDADGDNDPTNKGTILCIQGIDQNCVGRDEFYTIDIDTNLNFRFDDPEDLRLVYENNNLRLLDGNNNQIAEWNDKIEIVLGMAARTTGGPCPNENPKTFDIEMAIRDYSQLDSVPVCYGVDLLSGSQVDGPVEDFLNEPILVDDEAAPDLEIVKEVRNVTTGAPFDDNGVAARPGDEVEFRVTVTNTGNIRFATLAVTDPLPAQYVNIQVLSGDCSLMGSTINCQVANLDVGQSAVFLYRANVSPQAGQQIIRNTATATGTPVRDGDCGGDPVQKSDSARVLVLDLVCQKLVSVDGGVTFVPMAQAVPGQTLFFKVIIDNQSMIDIDMVTVTDVLPDAYDQVMVVSAECQANGNTVDCAIDSIPAGMMAEVIYKARLKPDVGPGDDVLNTAVVSGFFGQAEIETQCSASVDVLEASVDCTKEVSLDGVNFFPSVFAVNCQDVLFRVTVTNTAGMTQSATLFNVTIDDLLPGQYSNIQIVNGAGCSAVGNQVSCVLPDPIGPGMSAQVLYRAVFDGAVNGQEVVNTANVEATPGVGPEPEQQGTPLMTSCPATVTTLVPDIACEKGVSLVNGGYKSQIQAVPGQEVFFRVRLMNTGSAPFFSTIVFDELPSDCFANLQIVSGAGCTVNGTTIECDLGGLAPNAKRTIIYKAVVVGADQVCTNTARVTGTPGTKENPGCAAVTECSTSVDILNVDIVCDKNVSLDGVTFFDTVAAQPGDTVWFEVLIDIPQGGEACFLNVQLTDTLAPQFTNIMIVDGASCSVNGNTVSCTDIGPVPFCPPNAPLRVVYKADLIEGDLPPTVTNTAMIEAIPGIPGVAQGGTPDTTECSSIVQVLDLEIECVKTATPAAVVPGQTVTFEVVITNVSKSDTPFDRVKLTDTLSVGFDTIAVLEPAGLCNVNQSQRRITCEDLGPLPRGESITVRYTARVRSDAPPILSNDARVEGHFGQIVKVSTCPVTIPLLTPCIECVKEATLSPNNTGYGNPIEAIPGQRVYFRVTITNCSEDAPLFRVSLRDVLPAGFSDLQLIEGNCTVNGNTLDCTNLGGLGVGASLVVRFSGLLDDDQPPGEIVNTATVTGFPGSEGNPGITVASSCPIPIRVLRIDFVCTKLVSLDGVNYSETVEAVPGQTVFFRVDVENTGEVPVVLTLTDDIGLVFVNRVADDPDVCAFAGTVLTCTFPLATGENRVIDYHADLRSSAEPGTYVNTVDLAVETGPPQNPGAEREKGNACSANVVALEPEIVCEKGISLNGIDFFPVLVVQPEDRVFYRVIIRNPGPGDLRNVTLTDTLPADCFIDVVVTTPTPDCQSSGNTIDCELGDLAEGEQFEIRYEATVRVDPADDCPNTVQITAETGTEQNPGDTIETECSALATTLIIRIPTLDEIGLLLLIAGLGATLVWFRRRG